MTSPVVEPTVAYEYLHRALTLLEKPGNGVEGTSWIRNAEAVDADGRGCKPESEKAQAWCTIGVVKAVTHYDSNPQAAYNYILSLLNLANPMVIEQGSLPSVNDSHQFETVRKMFLKAQKLVMRFGG